MKIVRSNEVEWQQAIDHGKFSSRRKPLSSERLAAGLWELPPGKRSWPLHMHHVTEEGMFVISGRAKVRTTDGETEIGPGDYVAFPAGAVAHQLINDGTEPLIYVGLSAGVGHDLVEYPDSGKVSMSVGQRPTGKRFIYRGEQAGYFDGEED